MAHEQKSPDTLSETVVAAIVLAAGHGTRFGQPKYSVTLRVGASSTGRSIWFDHSVATLSWSCLPDTVGTENL